MYKNLFELNDDPFNFTSNFFLQIKFVQKLNKVIDIKHKFDEKKNSRF